MRYNILRGHFLSIFFLVLLLLPFVYASTTTSPKNVQIEVKINADGTIVCSPDPAVVDDEDTVSWHIETNDWGAKNFTLILPGPRYPVQPGGEHTINDPEHCDFVRYDGDKDFYVMWPPGMESYTYGVDAKKNPEISAYAQLIKPSAFGGVWVPVDKFGLLAPYIALASTILVATAATAIYVKRVKRREEKQ